jgi:hypothetical protein
MEQWWDACSYQGAGYEWHDNNVIIKAGCSATPSGTLARPSHHCSIRPPGGVQIASAASFLSSSHGGVAQWKSAGPISRKA